MHPLFTVVGVHASMRPPEFTGGNPHHYPIQMLAVVAASMRPPEFTGGNACGAGVPLSLSELQ